MRGATVAFLDGQSQCTILRELTFQAQFSRVVLQPLKDLESISEVEVNTILITDWGVSDIVTDSHLHWCASMNPGGCVLYSSPAHTCWGIKAGAFQKPLRSTEVVTSIVCLFSAQCSDILGDKTQTAHQILCYTQSLRLILSKSYQINYFSFLIIFNTFRGEWDMMHYQTISVSFFFLRKGFSL